MNKGSIAQSKHISEKPSTKGRNSSGLDVGEHAGKMDNRKIRKILTIQNDTLDTFILDRSTQPGPEEFKNIQGEAKQQRMELIQEQEKWSKMLDDLHKAYVRESEADGFDAGTAQISDKQADFIDQSRTEQYVSPLALSVFQFDKYDEDLKYSDEELDALLVQYDLLNEKI